MPEDHHSGGNHANSVTHIQTDEVDETYESEGDKPLTNPPSTFSDIDSEMGSRHFILSQKAILSKEADEIGAKINSEEYLVSAIRLNALFESYIEFMLRSEYSHEFQRDLSELESEAIRTMGHQNRINKAKEFDILGEYIQGAINALRNVRNDPAHNVWSGISVDNQYKSAVKHAHDQLVDHIAHLENEHL